MDQKPSRVILSIFSLSVIMFSMVGLYVSARHIIGARYLTFSMYNSSLMILRDNLNNFLLLALSVSLFTAVLYLFLSRRKSLEGPDAFIRLLIATALVFLLLLGGYYLNRFDFFPPFFTVRGFFYNILYTASITAMCFVAYLLRRGLYNLLNPLKTLSWWFHLLSWGLVLSIIILNLAITYRRDHQGKRYTSILLISLDTLRWDHLGCYGYDLPTSPSIDEFAKESVLFSNMISQSSWTLPSHMSIFTSQYPPEHGAIKDNLQINTGQKGLLLSEILKERFYTNVAYTGGGWLDHCFGFSRGFDIYSDTKATKADYKNPIDKRTIRFLEQNRGAPFFLFLHTYCIHNYYAPDEYREIFDSGCDGRLHQWDKLWSFVKLHKDLALDSAAGKEDLKHIIRLYDASIRYVDNRIGLLFQKLKDLGLYNDMMIIITSDHGEEFGEHGHTFHANSLYEEMIRIPLIIKFPGSEFGGTRVEDLVRHIDIVPTILDYLEIEPLPWMRGISVIPLIKGESRVEHYAFSDAENRQILRFSLRTPRYHLIYESFMKGLMNEDFGDFRLYDILNDPGEQVDISRVEEELFASLKEDLLEWISKLMPGESVEYKPVPLNREVENKLRALGYIQ